MTYSMDSPPAPSTSDDAMRILPSAYGSLSFRNFIDKLSNIEAHVRRTFLFVEDMAVEIPLTTFEYRNGHTAFTKQLNNSTPKLQNLRPI